MKLRLTFDRAVLAALAVLSLALAAQNHSLRRDVRDLRAQSEALRKDLVRNTAWLSRCEARLDDFQRPGRFTPSP